jgi:hypothetical protein
MIPAAPRREQHLCANLFFYFFFSAPPRLRVNPILSFSRCDDFALASPP